jgi:hypothetical protein
MIPAHGPSNNQNSFAQKISREIVALKKQPQEPSFRGAAQRHGEDASASVSRRCTARSP